MSTLYRFVLVSIMVFCSNNLLAAKYEIAVENIDFYPHYGLDKNKQYIGFARELLDSFAKASGHEFTYRAYPVSRLFGYFFDGKLDFKYPDNPHWSEEPRKNLTIHYSNTVAPFEEGAFVLEKNSTLELAGIQKLGTIRGFTPIGWTDLIAEKKVTLNESNSSESVLRLLYAERVNAVFLERSIATYLAKNISNAQPIVFKEGFPRHRDAYFLATTKHKDVIEQLNKFLEENKPLLNSLHHKYGLVKY